MNYRIIDRDIAGKLSANETYTLFCLLSKSDYTTGLSHIKQETLKDIIGIKKIDTLQSHLSKFYELNILRKKRGVILATKAISKLISIIIKFLQIIGFV